MQKKKKGSTISYAVIAFLDRVLFYLLFRPKVIGKGNIPKKGPYVLAGNHANWLDPVMLVAVVNQAQIHFLAKEELWHGKSKFLVKIMGSIPVNRKIHDKDALVSAYEYLNNGCCIGIFPEGTINRTSDWVMPFKIGAVKMCNVTGAKLVPFVITGEYKLFGKGITIEFLKAREVSDDLDLENKKLMELVSSKLKKRGKKDGKK